MSLIVTAGRVALDSEGQGDYHVRVRVNDREIWNGMVRGHDRRNGWPALLREIASEAENRPSNK